MRPTLIRRAGFPKFPGLYRKNNVPHWQRIHQEHDGVRQWDKGPRAKALLWPYYTLLTLSFAGSQYMAIRMVFGHKTWI